MIVQKVLRSLPMRFDPNMLALEERKYLDTLSMDELHGIFTTYEMRIEKENPSKKEATFKTSKMMKNKKKNNSKTNLSYNNVSNEDEEKYNFVRKLRRVNNEYKGIIPLK
jgi:hypothetical protein